MTSQTPLYHKDKSGGLRALRACLRSALALPWEKVAQELKQVSPHKTLISPLRTFFMDGDELIRWRSISAFGMVVSWIAEEDMEEARIIMRQLMWTLNDESGGIGWGSPEAMGESMALNPTLCSEYGKILLSYIWEEGNFLEYDALRVGALWGIMRSCLKQREIMNGLGAPDLLRPYLDDPDIMAVALSAMALSSLGHDQEVADSLTKRGLQGRHIRIYMDGDFQEIRLL